MHCTIVAMILFVSPVFSQPSWNTGAKWIGINGTVEGVPVFKKRFATDGKIASAKLRITARGLYEGFINEQRIGDALLTPGWTSYDKRLQFQEYEVTKQIHPGTNEIRVTVADGWYHGALGIRPVSNHYGNEIALLFELVITYKDKHTVHINSDKSWEVSSGALLFSSLYDGEIYDANKSTSNWSNATEVNYAKTNLVPTLAEPVRRQEQFEPSLIFTTPKHEQVIDFGQNLAGWVKLKVRGKPGDTIRISHAEVLDSAGNFYTANLRQAKATDVYILKGDKEEIFEPHFTYHGFRYIKVEGCKANKEDFTAIALYSNMSRTGSFSCSDTLLNRLQKNIEWSLQSNFIDIPTDCPQRSERLGWTGDAQIFFRTASFNRDVKAFFSKWLTDLAADQGTDGAVPVIIPDLYGHANTNPKKSAAGWGDAATIIPWQLFQVYNDTATLKRQYSSMKAWVDYISSVSDNYLWQGKGFGDWLSPGAETPVPFIDQCYWAYSTQLLINAATVLGNKQDAKTYGSLLEKIKEAFVRTYMKIDGTTIANTQTSYVLALRFYLLPASLHKKAVEQLVNVIRENNYHLTTGFLGTPYLLPVLSDNGYTDVAFRLLQQQTYPSWLYAVKAGATTMWERWDAIKPDGSVQPTTYNHYAYGAVGDWLYRVLAGIDAAEPGYKKIVINPHFGGGLSWVKAAYTSASGKIISEWTLKENNVEMHVVIPGGTSAIVCVPGQEAKVVGEGEYTFHGHLPE